jgi:CheY-like chemotaxis protein
MARVVVFSDDLLFGSRVLEALHAEGQEAALAGGPEAVQRELVSAGLLIVDLTTNAAERLDAVRRLRRRDVPTMAYYSHVEAEVRSAAEEAGIDLVVPRSRMAREGASLAVGLLRARDEA